MSARRVAKPTTALALQAFVLHQYDWSESSLIVELFSRERGRVVVVAKGAKRPTSNFRAVLLPFHRLQVQLGRAPADERSEIHALRHAELHGWQGGLPRTAAAMFAGFYANELVLRLLPREDPHPALFDRFADALAALSVAGESAHAQPPLRAFELVLLRVLGWLPELHVDAQTLEPLGSATRYELHADRGLTPAASPVSIDGARWLQLEAALAHGSFAALVDAVAPIATVLRVPLRGLLHYHLDASTLRTRAVMQGVQSLLDR